jgi:predicted dehydrogenase
MNAGKHLFIEKPMASNVQNAFALNVLSKQKHVVLHVDHIYALSSDHRKIKQLFDFR